VWGKETQVFNVKEMFVLLLCFPSVIWNMLKH